MAFRTVQVDIDDAAFQAALNRATIEGKAVGQVVADFLRQYAAGATTGAPTTYTVQSGDTLGKIAQRVYGDARKYPLIQQANNLADPSRIWVGQVLVIPPVGQPVPVPAPPTPITPVPVPPAPVTPAPAPIPPPPPAPPVPTEAPTKPAIRWVGSPNFNRRPDPNNIWAITMHATANSSLQGVIDWFNNPSAMVSAHYTIDKDGTIVQHVRDTDRAWHAGQSVWQGVASCNDFCLGIEMVNLNNGQDPYPEAQHQSAVALVAYLSHLYNIKPENIHAHYDIALPPGRKSDPKGYDMDRLRREVAAILGGGQ